LGYCSEFHLIGFTRWCKIGHPKLRFESGDNIQVDTLLWIPPVKPSPLIQRLVENMGLELDEQGYVKTDEKQQTNVRGLFVAGDIQGSKGALVAANYDGIAATSIAHEWYD
jgi:thioredoxin reductase